MKSLYARLVLSLVRPALDLWFAPSASVRIFVASDLGSLSPECRSSIREQPDTDIAARQRFYEASLGLSEGKEWRAYRGIKPSA
ncbi:hypothetical protein [Burkholderia gladioli]|uniref:hypothetical protein n=1 Tax=Burkholderia gladioli TaxID=28095 RepID=UPI0012D34C4C|nr:hypothetical protein [Burkholderia gladioli]